MKSGLQIERRMGFVFDSQEMAYVLKEKAIETLDGALVDVGNKRTEILNAEYALGKFCALEEILWGLDIGLCTQLVKQTQARREELLSIVENIYVL